MKPESSVSAERNYKAVNRIILVVIILLVSVVLALNSALFFGMINNESELLGREQLETVSSRLKLMLRESEILVRRLAAESELLINGGSTHQELLDHFTGLKSESVFSDCENIYIAGEGWYVVPGTELDSSFDPTNRVWYQGARKNGVGNVFISSPYVDIVTGELCFSVSMMLEDRVTVVGLDLALDPLQESLAGVVGDTLIVSSSWLIVAYTDESVIGQKLSDALPGYTTVFQKILSSGENSMYFNASISGVNSTVFFSCTENDWYLISAVSDYELHKDQYFRLIRNSLLILLLAALMIVLYVVSHRIQRRRQKALELKYRYISGIADELHTQMRNVLHYSNEAAARHNENGTKLRESAVNLDHLITDMLSFSAASAQSAEGKGKNHGKRENSGVLSEGNNRFVIIGVLAILAVTMVIVITLSTNAVISGGNNRLRGEAGGYEKELELWVNTQKTTVETFTKCISADPSLMSDYDSAVQWLDSLTVQYPDISVTYMANPEWDHIIIMNNGWQPGEDFVLEQRPWYIDTLSSRNEDGFTVSSPYFDAQTGLYCITFSQRVYTPDGEFIGCFCADFYIDKLTDILSDSYTDEGYAFLADKSGRIINHPNEAFELSDEKSVSVEEAGYLDVIYSDEIVFMNDYDGARRAAVAVSEPVSGFTVICVRSNFAIYGEVAYYNVTYVILFGLCIAGILYIMHRQMKWQKKANELLKISAREAQRAGDAKSQFLAQMSHEIRTPINAVLGMNEMILRESRDRNINEYAENIQNAGRTLLSLINSILDFSKIEDGKMEIVPVNYDTASMVNDLVNMIGQRAEKKGLELKTEIDGKLPRTMFGDDVRLRQVITNLLTNAVKYTDTGTVWLRMSVGDIESGTVTLHVEVEDTGTGIRDEDKERLFGSFQRLDLERNRGVEGTGLGMSIVQQLLRLMKSELKVDSVYGEGSRFCFDVVQGVVDAQLIGDYTGRLERSRVSGREESYVFAPGARVLIVDDNELNLVVARGLLKRTGMSIDTAMSGNDGIRLAGENSYDIIFLDHMMPELDGIDTLKLMKERSLIPENTAVIMMTANAIVGAREEYLQAGFDDYISKPIDVRQMEKLLSQYIPAEKLSYKTAQGAVPSVYAASRADSAPKQTPQVKISRIDKLKLIPELDINAGMRYCSGDEDFYIETVRAYVNNSVLEKLDELYSSEDITDYTAALRRLMNNSRTIGAAAVYSAAKEASDAIAEKKMQLAREKHRDLLSVYRRILGYIYNALK